MPETTGTTGTTGIKVMTHGLHAADPTLTIHAVVTPSPVVAAEWQTRDLRDRILGIQQAQLCQPRAMATILGIQQWELC